MFLSRQESEESFFEDLAWRFDLSGTTLITGSFNFTDAAEEKNAENLLVIKGDPGLVKKCLANFEEHLGHSERYTGKN